MFRNLFERQQFYGDIKLCLSKTLSDLRKTGWEGPAVLPHVQRKQGTDLCQLNGIGSRNGKR